MDGRKIKSEYENPIDNWIYKLVSSMDNIFYQINFTPNILTFLSLTTGLLSSYYLKKKNYVSILLLFISYFLDYSDGYFARKHNMVSEFGDFFDHISDVVKSFSLIYTMYTIDKKLIMNYMPIIILLTVLSCYHLSLQEKIYNKQQESSTLNILNNHFTFNEQNIVWTRFFNFTTLMIILFYLMYQIIKKNNQ